MPISSMVKSLGVMTNYSCKKIDILSYLQDKTLLGIKIIGVYFDCLNDLL